MSDKTMENLVAAIMPGGIEAQEKRGQLEQAVLQTLPIDLHKQREAFEFLGFDFGEPVDEIFQAVQFPSGWKKAPTDHSMWSDILDDQGRKRGLIFYKAAFYDRKAHAHLVARFSVSRDYEHPGPDVVVRVCDACGVVKEAISGLPVPDWSGDKEVAREDYRKEDNAISQLRDWLDENYPDWRNPLKHWDIPVQEGGAS